MKTPLRPPILNVFRRLGLEPDPWQLEVLEGDHRRLLLNCSRQSGKSTVVALLALIEAASVPGAVILLLSRSQRQSTELFRMVAHFFSRLNAPYLKRKTAYELELLTRSRIVSLPCNADTIRGFSGVHMLVIDEAARVPDDLYRTVRPMLAASQGRLVCLSTPCGQHGFFHHAWSQGGDDWKRIQIPADQCPRITPSFLEEEKRCLGETWYRQEYFCSFESLEGLVYPDFSRCVESEPGAPATGVHVLTPPPSPLIPSPSHTKPQFTPPLTKGGQGGLSGRPVGGIDFGFRNPFAAVWGTLDRDGILWLSGEYYCRQQPLSEHARHLPRNVTWYADPSGASDIAELRCAGFAVRKGLNALRPGIMAVTARLNSGTLRILPGACPNLLKEASLYRWSEADTDSENPIDEHNHALAALRYLITRLDERKQARPPRETAPEGNAAVEVPKPKRPWLSLYNEALWRPISWW